MPSVWLILKSHFDKVNYIKLLQILDWEDGSIIANLCTIQTDGVRTSAGNTDGAVIKRRVKKDASCYKSYLTFMPKL